MPGIKIFEAEAFGQVRVVDVDGEPWFVARDVCECLELGNPRTSIALLDEDEKGVHTMDTPGGQQEMSIVSEAGLYSLILRSRKPEAKAFKRWITHEVLPSIRKTGQYGILQYRPSTHARPALINSACNVPPPGSTTTATTRPQLRPPVGCTSIVCPTSRLVRSRASSP